MTLAKRVFLFGVLVLAAVFVGAAWKKWSRSCALPTPSRVVEIPLSTQEVVYEPVLSAPTHVEVEVPRAPAPQSAVAAPPAREERVLPEADLVDQLFAPSPRQLNIVETITYRSRVPWLKGRPAWLSDYASHYKTSRHFIGRSLHGAGQYLNQEISEGDRFNVLCSDCHLEFHLVVDLSRCRMWFYALHDGKEPLLLKTYSVSVGRVAPEEVSGLLTPTGKYRLGERVAAYAPKAKGTYRGKNIEMVTVFGTRWIPFERELGACSKSAKGYGLHGVPWRRDGDRLIEMTESLGKYASDGCIRLKSEDIEEVYAIIISRPTTIEIVKDFFDSGLVPRSTSQ